MTQDELAKKLSIGLPIARSQNCKDAYEDSHVQFHDLSVKLFCRHRVTDNGPGIGHGGIKSASLSAVKKFIKSTNVSEACLSNL